MSKGKIVLIVIAVVALVIGIGAYVLLALPWSTVGY